MNLELRESLSGKALASIYEALSLILNSESNNNNNNNNMTSNNVISQLLKQLPELRKEMRLNQTEEKEIIASLLVFPTVYVKILHPLGCFDFGILLRDLPETL